MKVSSREREGNYKRKNIRGSKMKKERKIKEEIEIEKRKEREI